MNLLILVAAMVVVGLVMGFVAGLIWKDNRPIGVQGDYIVAVITVLVVGFLDWFVIPALGFSTAMRNLGIALEPALSALLVLWLIRVAKK